MAVVVLASFLAVQERDDLSYALSSPVPIQLGDLHQPLGRPWPVNRYVQMTGTPDRESAVILDTQGSWQFRQFFRVLGAGGRLFVQRAPDPLPLELAERDLFTGRLVPLASLPFRESIRHHFAGHVTATHQFAPETVRAALQRPGGGGGVTRIADRLGEMIPLTLDDELTIETPRPDEFLIEFPLDRFPDIDKARLAVTARGGTLVPSPAQPFSPPTAFVSLVARFPPPARDRALSELGDLDRRVRMRPARFSLRVKLRDLHATAEGFRADGAGGPVLLSLSQVDLIALRSPVAIPADAMVLVEGDRPRDHTKTVIMVAILAAFALVNLLVLRRPT